MPTLLNIDWIKLGSLVLGLVGTGLGIYNLLVAHRERKQKVKHGFALMLLSLDPIIDKLLAIPLQQPADLEVLDSAALSRTLTEIDDALEKEKKELINLVPEIAGCILNLKFASYEFRRKLNNPSIRSVDLLHEATAFLRASWSFAYFRSFARDFEISLNDQGAPSLQNWTGDTKIEPLNARWELFFRANERRGV